MRIVSWNVRGGLGMDNVRAIGRVAEILRELAPDIVCLQEIHRRLRFSGLVDQPAQLAAALGMQPVFHGASRLWPGDYGNMILTSYPVDNVRQVVLENSGERHKRPHMAWERRGYLAADITTPLGVIRVATTHWSLDAGDRLASAGLIAWQAAISKVPVVLTGDLNTQPGTPELATLLGQAGLVDGGNGLLTYPSDTPKARIDFILTTARLDAPALSTHATEASDHLPVIADW